MQHPYLTLAPEYAALLAAMRVEPAREHELADRAADVLDLAQRHGDEWAEVEDKTGVPRLWGIASFERESSSDYRCSPAQGDRWDSVSVNVPRGLGPYRCWGDACVAAYEIDHLNEVGKSAWTWTHAAYEGELYNGFGPRAHGHRTSYLWSWTSVYDGGKYIADGHWSPRATDEQCGMIPMMQALLALDAALALADALPAHVNTPLPQVQIPDVFSRTVLPGVRPLQVALNRLGASPPITVDGSYGRETRRAVIAFQQAHGLSPDGIAGPVTWAAINTAQAAHRVT